MRWEAVTETRPPEGDAHGQVILLADAAGHILGQFSSRTPEEDGEPEAWMVTDLQTAGPLNFMDRTRPLREPPVWYLCVPKPPVGLPRPLLFNDMLTRPTEHPPANPGEVRWTGEWVSIEAGQPIDHRIQHAILTFQPVDDDPVVFMVSLPSTYGRDARQYQIDEDRLCGFLFGSGLKPPTPLGWRAHAKVGGWPAVFLAEGHLPAMQRLVGRRCVLIAQTMRRGNGRAWVDYRCQPVPELLTSNEYTNRE